MVQNITAQTTVASVETYWILDGEITNLYPYSVFISVPEEIEYVTKDLRSSKNFVKLTSGETSDVRDKITVDISPMAELNGQKGFWLYPYTKVNFKMYSNRTDTLSTENEDGDGVTRTMEIVGPSIYPKTQLIDLNELIPASKQTGIKIDNFKLTVTGSIKKRDTEVMSIIVPAPVVLKDYSRFDKFTGRYSLNRWVDSYSDYIFGHKETSNYGLALLDNSLVPILDFGISYNIFDVPAIVYTTSSGNEFDFFYQMYWYEKNQNYNIQWI
jgi:hypothetical protein